MSLLINNLFIFTLIIFGLSVLYHETNAYVLLQVRKQDANHSNVDALIHKVIPSEKIHKIKRDTSRKQFGNRDSVEVRSRGVMEPGLESLIFAINTGAEKKFDNPSNPNMMSAIKNTIMRIAQKAAPLFKAKSEQYNFKPEIINFRSKGKPSMMYEVNSQSILNALKDMLSSDKLHKHVGNIARKAAVVYRAMKEDLTN